MALTRLIVSCHRAGVGIRPGHRAPVGHRRQSWQQCGVCAPSPSPEPLRGRFMLLVVDELGRTGHPRIPCPVGSSCCLVAKVAASIGTASSTAAWLPGAGSASMPVNSWRARWRADRSAGPRRSRPMGPTGSNPLSCNACGQSLRRSTAISRRFAGRCVAAASDRIPLELQDPGLIKFEHHRLGGPVQPVRRASRGRRPAVLSGGRPRRRPFRSTVSKNLVRTPWKFTKSAPNSDFSAMLGGRCRRAGRPTGRPRHGRRPRRYGSTATGSGFCASSARAAATNNAVDPTLVLMSQVSLSVRMYAFLRRQSDNLLTGQVTPY